MAIKLNDENKYRLTTGPVVEKATAQVESSFISYNL